MFIAGERRGKSSKDRKTQGGLVEGQKSLYGLPGAILTVMRKKPSPGTVSFYLLTFNTLLRSGATAIVPGVTVNDIPLRVLPRDGFITQFERFKMGAAHPVRGQEGCHCRELNVFHHDIEIFGLDTRLQNTVHLNNPLLHHSPFAHGSVKKWGSLIKFFDYRNRAMDARAGELAPTWVNRNGYAM